MGQAEALAALEAAGKSGAKTFLTELSKPGGALELELQALVAASPVWVQGLEAVLVPMVEQAIASLAGKL